MCSLRDNLEFLQAKGAKIVVITCDTVALESSLGGAARLYVSDPLRLLAPWVTCLGLRILSTSNSDMRRARPIVIDGDGVITDIIASENLSSRATPDSALGL